MWIMQGDRTIKFYINLAWKNAWIRNWNLPIGASFGKWHVKRFWWKYSIIWMTSFLLAWWQSCCVFAKSSDQDSTSSLWGESAQVLIGVWITSPPRIWYFRVLNPPLVSALLGFPRIHHMPSPWARRGGWCWHKTAAEWSGFPRKCVALLVPPYPPSGHGNVSPDPGPDFFLSALPAQLH